MWYSEFDWVWKPGEAPSPFSALPPHTNYLPLHLNAFRREPAIPGFDWNFSATHSSSHRIFPLTCSVLQSGLTPLQPVHG
jgi:hypothetical protein